MAIRWPLARRAVALLLLALVTAPLARAAQAASDSHRCCPERAPAAESPMRCQYLAPLGCCGQLGLTSTPSADDTLASPLALAIVAISPVLPEPSMVHLARARGDHGPPQDASLRTTVLRL